jgi:hypothetical protein
MEIRSERNLKIGLAVILILCLFSMPYGYYKFVRVAGLVGFPILGFISLTKREPVGLTLLYFCLAVLFQPFYKFNLGREWWNFVDLAVAVGLIYSVRKPQHETEK